MVREIAARGEVDTRTLQALARVPRHLFVPEMIREQAYGDHPLPLGYGQTISQPYVVGWMTSLLALEGGERVLEIGTGSGYQTAVLAEMAAHVFSIEIVAQLARRAAQTLAALGYHNVSLRTGDGNRGWPEEAPFDAIMLTAAPPQLPQAVAAQLARGGRLVAPVGAGSGSQMLRLITRRPDGALHQQSLGGVRFVPLVAGEADDETQE